MEFCTRGLYVKQTASRTHHVICFLTDRESVLSIITVAEASKAVVMRAANSAVAMFSSAVGPVFVRVPRSKPRHCGSCVFVSLRGRTYLITAKHVLDEQRHGSLYIGGPSKVVELVAEVAYSGANLSPGEVDRHDIAVAALHDELVQRLGVTNPIDLSTALSWKPALSGDRYMILGYPHSKNRHALADPKRLPQVDWALITRAKATQSCAAKPYVNAKMHLVLDWDSKQTIDADLNRITSPNPRGMSGGAVFDLGNFTDHEVLAGIRAPVPRLVAIPIEHHDREDAIVCLRLTTVIAILDAGKLWPQPLRGSRPEATS